MPKPKRSISGLLKSDRAKKFISYDLLEEGQSLANAQKDHAESKTLEARSRSLEKENSTKEKRDKKGASKARDTELPQSLLDDLILTGNSGNDPVASYSNEGLPLDRMTGVKRLDGERDPLHQYAPTKKHSSKMRKNEAISAIFGLGEEPPIAEHVDEESIGLTPKTSQTVVLPEEDLSVFNENQFGVKFPNGHLDQSKPGAQSRPFDHDEGEFISRAAGLKASFPQHEAENRQSRSEELAIEEKYDQVAGIHVPNDSTATKNPSLNKKINLLGDKADLVTSERAIIGDENALGWVDHAAAINSLELSKLKHPPGGSNHQDEEVWVGNSELGTIGIPGGFTDPVLKETNGIVAPLGSNPKKDDNGTLTRRSQRTAPVTVGKPSMLPPPPKEFDFDRDERFLSKYWMSPGPGGLPRSQERFFNFYRFLYSEANRTQCARVYCTEAMAVDVLGAKARGTFSNYRKLGVQYGLFKIHIVSNFGNAGQQPGTYFYLQDPWKS